MTSGQRFRDILPFHLYQKPKKSLNSGDMDFTQDAVDWVSIRRMEICIQSVSAVMKKNMESCYKRMEAKII